MIDQIKKTSISLFIIFFSCFTANSQEFVTVNYEELQTKITDDSSDLYYPSLLKRYKSGDQSLTVREFRALYYGFTFQKEYRPYERDPRDEQISELIASGLDEKSTAQLIKISNEYLEDKPFSLKIMNYLQNFMAAVKDTSKIELLDHQYKGIVSAILSSGDGASPETGYSVNHPSDEYMVLRSMQLKPTDNLFETTFDYFTLEKNEYNIEGIYFDVYQMAKVGTQQLGIETIEVENESIPEDGILVGSRDEILSFVPLGFEVLSELNVDFDQDGDLDWILILNKEGEKALSNAAANDPEPRLFMILERSDDKMLQERLSSLKVIPCIDCGDGSDSDPFQSMVFENNTLSIFTAGGSMFRWERESKFVFDEQFILQQELFKSYRKGKKDQAQTDVETSEDFGTVLLSEFDYRSFLE